MSIEEVYLMKIPSYKFNDITLGDHVEFSVKVTHNMVEKFANLSGDFNPIHMDESFAKNTKFKKRICHGMLLASFFSQLLGMHMPGKNTIYFSQSLNFQSPCYINDEIIVKGEVIEKSSSTRIIILKTTIENKNKICIIDGIAKVIVLE